VAYIFSVSSVFGKFLRINLYNALPILIVLYGSEIWDFRLKGNKQLTSVEIKFCRTAEYELFDYKKSNEKILEELKVESV